MLCPYPFQGYNLENKGMTADYFSNSLCYWSNRLKCSTMALAFGQDGRVETYCKEDAGYLDAAISARDQFCEANQLPKNRITLFGLSLGATMAERIAVRHPQDIEAVIMLNGIGFYFPLTPGSEKIKWLIADNRDAYSEEINRRLAGELHKRGSDVIYYNFPPEYQRRGDPKYYHSYSKPAFDLVQCYLWSIQQGMENQNPWTYATPYPAKDGYKVMKAEQAAIKPENAQDWVKLPNATFASMWLKQQIPTLPYDPLSISGYKIPLRVTLPSCAKPKGIIFYVDTTVAPDGALAEFKDEDIYQLAELGYLVFSRCEPSLSSGEEYLSACKMLMKNYALDYQQLPLIAFLRGEDSWKYMQAFNADKEIKLKSIFMANVELMENSSESTDALKVFAQNNPQHLLSYQIPGDANINKILEETLKSAGIENSTLVKFSKDQSPVQMSTETIKTFIKKL